MASKQGKDNESTRPLPHPSQQDLCHQRACLHPDPSHLELGRPLSKGLPPVPRRVEEEELAVILGFLLALQEVQAEALAIPWR